jgi:sortase A
MSPPGGVAQTYPDSVSATDAAAPRRPTWRTWRWWVRGTGELLVTAGVVVLLFVVYELWWTGFTTQRDQHNLINQLHREWAAPLTKPVVPPYGSGLAILFIPRLGAHYKFAVVQGTSTADLIKGPGHYPGSAMPGQIGNFAVAGHRTTYLHPFYDINELRQGDSVVVETRSTWYTYRVQNIPHTAARYQEIVSPSDVSVAFPVPDQPNPNLTPTQRVLTFTSCNPRYSAAQRIVVHGLLVASQPRTSGLPPALTTTRA